MRGGGGGDDDDRQSAHVSCAMMTSGAIQYGEPANVWRFAMECVSCTDSPKSASLSRGTIHFSPLRDDRGGDGGTGGVKGGSGREAGGSGRG